MLKTDKQFVHLHLHTDFSLLDAATRIGPLAEKAAALKMPAVAITDHGNLHGAIAFYDKMHAAGVKPIIGMEAYIARGSRHDRGTESAPQGEKANNHIVLLARNLEGYRNLVKLSSKAYLEGFYRKPRIDREILSEHREGLIGLSACLSGVPAQLLLKDRFDDAATRSLEFEDILGKGNYYLEVQDHGLDGEKRIRKPLFELSKRTGIPLVATNDVHYLLPQDYKAHDTLICIGTGKTLRDPQRLRYQADSYYLRPASEMWELFGEEPELLLRTVEIAEKCNLEFPKKQDYMPLFPVPEGYSLDGYFEKVVRDGFDQRFREVWSSHQASGGLKHAISDYEARLNLELSTIVRMGYPSYFLIVWDFIRYARQKEIPVGPGRGSAAGSLVAYCLRITDVDPMQYDLLFERFLNPERVSMPDIDIDFCVRGRQEVINYVSDLYGRENVAQIITFGTMASRQAIKDVGRAFDMPLAEVEKVAKMIPPPVRGRNVSITDAIAQNDDLRRQIESNPQTAELIDVARRLEGCSRHSSVHAAGVVISPLPLYELVPVCKSSNDDITTQFVMSDLEKTGMLKMDFLALTTLTIIEDCLKSIERSGVERPDLARIPLDDPATLKLFVEGNLNAVFQFESSGMVEICRRLKPEGLEDLSALNALYRPGPIDGGMIDDYIDRRHGKRKVDYVVPQMKEILQNTYGILVYQEQIMLLAQKLAGYSLGEADLMRRAMGKKKIEEMREQEVRFVQGAVERGIPEKKAKSIFELMAKFADYGFNRSHSFAYAYLAYQTAYLKAHYPEHFYAAVLTAESEKAGKVARYAAEMKGFHLELLPPDINASLESFAPDGANIRFGLGAIKGLGAAAVQAILEARSSGGPFTSLLDLADRIDQRAMNKRVFESLIKAGACDSLNANRAHLMSQVDKTLDYGSRVQRDRAAGQTGLFGQVVPNAGGQVLESEAWSRSQQLAFEKEAIGMYVSGHPLDDYAALMSGVVTGDTSMLSEHEHGEMVSVAGLISDLVSRLTKRKERFALFRLEDQFGSVKVVCWPEQFGKYRNLLSEGVPLIVKGKLELSDDGAASIIANEVMSPEDAQQRAASKVVVRCAEVDMDEEALVGLWDAAIENTGKAELQFEIETRDGLIVVLRPDQYLRVSPSDQLRKGISSISSKWKIEFVTGK